MDLSTLHIAAGTKKVVAAAVKKVLERLAHRADSEAKEWFRKLNRKHAINQIYKQVSKVRLVKTLWQVDKAVDLNEFYCDSHLIIDNERVLVRGISDLGKRTRILITGIAGQGKSILLRYLCSRSLVTGDCIPIFIELRRINEKTTVEKQISDCLVQYQIPDIDQTALQFFLSSGEMVLFLDGFDEVPESDKVRIMFEIEQLSERYETLKIIISSRPGTCFDHVAQFETLRLANLIGDEYKTLIHRLSETAQPADELIKQVELHKCKTSELLCTPLLVTLLVISYKSSHTIPDQLSEFYDCLLHSLLQRHDGSKPGFRRPRKCNLNDRSYRSTFEALCYETKNEVKSTFSTLNFEAYVKNAFEVLRITEDASNYIDDIVRITCLVLKDGEDYRYIHKSVQEYYSAAFIAHASEPIAKQFYEFLLTHKDCLVNWNQELEFLSEIDRYRVSKYFFSKYYGETLGYGPDRIPPTPTKTDLNDVNRVVGDVELWFGDSSMQCVAVICSYPVYPITNKLFAINYDSAEPHLLSGTRIDLPKSARRRISIKSLVKIGCCTSELLEVIDVFLKDVHAKAIQVQKYISREESVVLQVGVKRHFAATP